MNTPMLSQLEEARAPWNWDMDSEQCEEWEDVYYAENIHTDEVVEVKELTYHMLPSTYQEALRCHSNWVQGMIDSRHTNSD